MPSLLLVWLLLLCVAAGNKHPNYTLCEGGTIYCFICLRDPKWTSLLPSLPSTMTPRSCGFCTDAMPLIDTPCLTGNANRPDGSGFKCDKWYWNSCPDDSDGPVVCRPYTTCHDCLGDPRCGWCSSTKACVEGSVGGPMYDYCTGAWHWSTCGALPPPPPTPIPAPFIPPDERAPGWHMFGGDAAHTSYRDHAVGPVNPTKRWEVDLGFETTAGVVAEGQYAVIQWQMCFDMDDQCMPSQLHVLNETTGEEILLFNLSKTSAQSAAVYIPSPQGPMWVHQYDDLGFQIVVEGYSTSGERLWHFTSRTQGSTYPYGPTPWLDGGILYAGGGYYDQEMFAGRLPHGQHVFDVDLRPGECNFGDNWWTPAVWEGRVFWVLAPGENCDGRVGEVNASTGAAVWSVPVWTSWDGYSTFENVAVSKGKAFFAVRLDEYTMQLVAFSVSSPVNPHALWKGECPKPMTMPYGLGSGSSLWDYSAATDGSFVYWSCGDGVREYEAQSGSFSKLYSCSCYGQPLVTKDLVIGTAIGLTHVFNRTSGVELALIESSGMLAYHGGWLFISNIKGGKVSAYQLMAGKPQ